MEELRRWLRPCLDPPLDKLSQLLLLVMLIVSIVNCLARSDFNLVAYLLGYYIWIAGEEKPVDLKRDSVSRFNQLMVWVTAFDLVWLIWVSSVWTCRFADADVVESPGFQHCWAGPNAKLKLEEPLHRIAFVGSWVNLALKVVLLILQCVWVRQAGRGRAGTNSHLEE